MDCVIKSFGVARADREGDVYFAYTGEFIRFELDRPIPSLGYGNDPNGWLSRDSDLFAPGFKTKKLWVPRRYQLFFRLLHADSIRRHLFLVARDSLEPVFTQ